MTRLDSDVVIVGASVAGCATAVHLARRGLTVTVVDRQGFPREKACGEGLMPHGVRELHGLGWVEAVLTTGAQPFTGIGYGVGDAWAEADFPASAGFSGLGVRRLRMDAALVALTARIEGVTVETGVEVKDIARSADGVIVRTDQGEIRGRVVVGADGLTSMVRRSLGLRREEAGVERFGLRLHVAHPSRALRRVEVYVTPRAEVYLTPTGPDEANIAVLCETDELKSWGPDRQAAFWERVREVPAVAQFVEGSEPVSALWAMGPLKQGTTDVVADRGVLVGDAAGFVDALTGEGMSLALIGARLAAAAVADAIAAGDTTARGLRPYATRRRQAAHDLSVLTEIVVRGIRNRALARRFVEGLAADRALFEQVLAVNVGAAPWWSVGPRAVYRLGRGFSPQVAA